MTGGRGSVSIKSEKFQTGPLDLDGLKRLYRQGYKHPTSLIYVYLKSHRAEFDRLVLGSSIPSVVQPLQLVQD